jgi:hypothetical protein
MKIDQRRWTLLFGKGFKVGQAHQIGGYQAVIAIESGSFFNEMKRGTSHAPLPKPGGQCHEFDLVPGMGHQTQGEIPMRSAEKGFQKQKFQLCRHVRLSINNPDPDYPALLSN